MKIVKKNETKKFANSAACTAWEYPLGDKDINGAVIELNGRYPEKGFAINEKCKEMAYVVSGEGKLTTADGETAFSADDLLLIAAGEKYYWEGRAKIFMPCVPAWYPEQHKIVP